MEGENVEAVPSADNGNVPVDAPSEPTEPVVPTEPTEPVEPTEPELFELPDGRKVDAETLTKEWKENFLPDYTRKSQELAKTKTETLPDNKSTPSNPYADPDYVPTSYEEIIKVAEERALQAIERKATDEATARQAVENEVVTQLDSIKKLDPNLNENALFLHANKYGFRDLKIAHQNMKDMSALAKTVQQTTAKNIAKRIDPVSNTPGATGARTDPSHFGSAIEYMRSLK